MGDGKVVRFRHQRRVEVTGDELLEERLRTLEGAVDLLARRLAQHLSDHVGGVAIPGGDERGVDVGRGGRAGVAKTAGDGARVDPGGEQLGGNEVAQLSQLHPADPD